MPLVRKSLAVLCFSLLAACSDSPEVSLKGHQLRLFAVDQPAVAWITQDDVKSAVLVPRVGGQRPLMQVRLNPDADRRMQALTAANVGKTIRLTWDGTVVSDLTVKTQFGGYFQLPAPPT